MQTCLTVLGFGSWSFFEYDFRLSAAGGAAEPDEPVVVLSVDEYEHHLPGLPGLEHPAELLRRSRRVVGIAQEPAVIQHGAVVELNHWDDLEPTEFQELDQGHEVERLEGPTEYGS